MGLACLVDSNAVIDILMYRLPESGMNFLSGIKPTISIISRIELFCKKDIDEIELDKLSGFVPKVTIYQIDERVAVEAIDIRIKYRLKFPDAVIAATAIVHELTLITHNTSDFKNIIGLKLIDPYNL